ncbi:EVE domain-containing protein [Neobacillus niacini]|uniref:EVE domain-containing protein n=1 Tax=Neobacillus niacini TaxID=86668 RepID=UPI003B0174CD
MLSESAKLLLQYLVNNLNDIKAGDPYTYLSYKKVHQDIGLELIGQTYGQSLRVQGLGELADWLFKNKLPAITGIIVNSETYIPGKGYYEAFNRSNDDFLWWSKQIEESKKFNWNTKTTYSSTSSGNQKTWIFQGNPDDFKVDTYINENNKIWWSLNQQHFLHDISTGDIVYIWRSDGKNRGTGGIIARGVVSGSSILNIPPSKYWIKTQENTEKYNIPITIENRLLKENHIRRADLRENPNLNDLLILRMANNTNYLVKESQAKILHKIWDKYVNQQTKLIKKSQLKETVRKDLEADKAQFDSFYKDGELKHYYGNRYERKAKNRLKAIEIHGTTCTVCNFNFEDIYGDHGKDFIEIHHIKPLSTLGVATEIDPSTDLVPVCSNCHRMLHRNRDNVLTVDDLRKMVNLNSRH